MLFCGCGSAQCSAEMDRSQLGRLLYEHLIVTLTLVDEVQDGHMHHGNGQVDTNN